ncbi:CDP-alcohol phosphatidyltransferase family protein [uncultured Psychromonas sp.]|uniref:CDP-alcohol phosphatidyltransferase family protein n=1 Tax=uncultured Psychromonas sp. TaxID=173974 RepID=UPI0026368C82|nr:CDP-alcohol phosphatidyltransferase family protein [uncultured Psychromonas sp.]
MTDSDARRPLKVRDLKIMNQIAIALSKRNISPNQISITSVFFALLSGLCLIAVGSGSSIWLSWLAAILVQCRLLCNLFDGMVAMEGGKSTPSGELFNDIPDRVADPLILVCAGYAIAVFPWATELGWLAGLLAVMTAYVRVLATSMNAPTLFTGPMAKQHRMAIMTIALLLMPFEALLFDTQVYVLLIALLSICIGCVITLFNRSHDAYEYLESPQYSEKGMTVEQETSETINQSKENDNV